ncbi:Pre-mRNA-splicing factor slt11 [Paraphaeosphaeria minitans]|uniref:Pre-mRNA splicing factor SLT11 (RNA recognition domain-containing protein) n=1 Tax=Paraphaeosphaeria minitans TaxID=565426 RepID=A0A9P6KVE8_9PLEO|nr:pre-mRNA splicing factor SLT11 (RNA recognition domain-containing protein) [Paraphaeosphaeria minitans]
MPPQIKQDLNRSGWETTDFPSVCERCLPDNPYVQMLKEDYGAECKICTRPFTIFRWKADRTARQKRTNLCLTCARLKNCCQCCMLDLSFGLPIVVRDAALKMVAPGPQSDINRQYYAQEHEREIEEGRGAVEAYDKTDEKARDLLKRLAQSEPYYKKQRRQEAEGEGAQKALPAPGGESSSAGGHTPGPIRTRDSRGPVSGRGGMRPGRGGRVGGAPAAPSPEDWLPPRDVNVASLFVTGVEDDLPEHEIRTHFAQYGKLRSVVCSHRAHCAYINYVQRKDAETAAETLKGKVVIKGCPMKVTWGKPKQLDSLDQNVRMMYAKEGRQASGSARRAQAAIEVAPEASLDTLAAIAPPPGADDEVNYASLAGN